LAIHVVQYLSFVFCDATTKEPTILIVWYVRSIIFVFRGSLRAGLDVVLVVYCSMVFAIRLTVPIKLRRLINFIWNMSATSSELSNKGRSLGSRVASSFLL
jgi:hypothetical protein